MFLFLVLHLGLLFVQRGAELKNELVALLQFLIIVSLLFIVFLLEGLDHLLLRLARL